MFIDRAEIIIASGKGGDGAVTFRREPFVPEGGPDGGDGGNGGSVIFVADNNLRTLMDFKYKRKYSAANGENGMKRKKYGKKGKDLIIKVPVGTLIYDKQSGLLMKDLGIAGDRITAAKGGKGGKGNVHFKSSTRRAPNFAEAGGFPVERTVILELKLIADAGLIGFPNVGKSTILSVATSAKPKIANYHFTTIDPNLGVVDIYNKSFVLADIAGLIEGAHEGQGLGFKFLKHIERTKVLIHVVDVSGSEDRDPIDDYKKINNELRQYDAELIKKPQIVAANKMDIVRGSDNEAEKKYKSFINFADKEGIKVYEISAATGSGVNELMLAALEAVENHVPKEETHEMFDFNKEINDENYRKISARKEGGDKFVLEGRQLLKIFNSTNFNDDGSLRYLYKYLKKSGGIRQLKKLGLKNGDTIKIDDHEFEYYDD